MTILTIITNSNGHTVYFKEPIKNFQFIKLVSCSLFNSWINLKENGYINIIHVDKDKLRKGEKFIFPRGHYTPESVLYIFKNINYFSKINSPRGILVLPNTETKEIDLFTPSLHKLFGNYYGREDEDLVIKKFNTPHSYFIHCDLMNKTENLLNGKVQIFLQNFQSKGSLMKKSIIFLHRMGFFVKPRREIIIYIVSPFLSKMKMEFCLTLTVYLLNLRSKLNNPF